MAVQHEKKREAMFTGDEAYIGIAFAG